MGVERSTQAQSKPSISRRHSSRQVYRYPEYMTRRVARRHVTAALDDSSLQTVANTDQESFDIQPPTEAEGTAPIQCAQSQPNSLARRQSTRESHHLPSRDLAQLRQEVLGQDFGYNYYEGSMVKKSLHDESRLPAPSTYMVTIEATETSDTLNAKRTIKQTLRRRVAQARVLMQNPKADVHYPYLPKGLNNRIKEPKELKIKAKKFSKRIEPAEQLDLPPKRHERLVPAPNLTREYMPRGPAPERFIPPVMSTKELQQGPALDDFGNPAGRELQRFHLNNEEREQQIARNQEYTLWKKTSDAVLAGTGRPRVDDPVIGRAPPLYKRQLVRNMKRINSRARKNMHEQKKLLEIRPRPPIPVEDNLPEEGKVWQWDNRYLRNKTRFSARDANTPKEEQIIEESLDMSTQMKLGSQEAIRWFHFDKEMIDSITTIFLVARDNTTLLSTLYLFLEEVKYECQHKNTPYQCQSPRLSRDPRPVEHLECALVLMPGQGHESLVGALDVKTKQVFFKGSQHMQDQVIFDRGNSPTQQTIEVTNRPNCGVLNISVEYFLALLLHGTNAECAFGQRSNFDSDNVTIAVELDMRRAASAELCGQLLERQFQTNKTHNSPAWKEHFKTEGDPVFDIHSEGADSQDLSTVASKIGVQDCKLESPNRVALRYNKPASHASTDHVNRFRAYSVDDRVRVTIALLRPKEPFDKIQEQEKRARLLAERTKFLAREHKNKVNQGHTHSPQSENKVIWDRKLAHENRHFPNLQPSPSTSFFKPQNLSQSFQKAGHEQVTPRKFLHHFSNSSSKDDNQRTRNWQRERVEGIKSTPTTEPEQDKPPQFDLRDIPRLLRIDDSSLQEFEKETAIEKTESTSEKKQIRRRGPKERLWQLSQGAGRPKKVPIPSIEDSDKSQKAQSSNDTVLDSLEQNKTALERSIFFRRALNQKLLALARGELPPPMEQILSNDPTESHQPHEEGLRAGTVNVGSEKIVTASEVRQDREPKKGEQEELESRRELGQAAVRTCRIRPDASTRRFPIVVPNSTALTRTVFRSQRPKRVFPAGTGIQELKLPSLVAQRERGCEGVNGGRLSLGLDGAGSGPHGPLVARAADPLEVPASPEQSQLRSEEKGGVTKTVPTIESLCLTLTLSKFILKSEEQGAEVTAMDRLTVRSPEGGSTKAKALEDARQMQARVIEECTKAGKDPPPYGLVELIGKGSFGRVYMGKDMKSAAIVAVKIIDIDESDTVNPRIADSYSEFLKEVNALKILSENKAKNINHVIEALPVNQAMWMITEYCGGGSVATLMKPTQPAGLMEKWIIPIVREVAEAVKWVHQAGIIHRDIKCANVLITEQGDVQLCDFGVAGIVESNFDKRSTIIGTPHWMAPELLDKTPSYGKEVDIWAFGAMVFEMATGLPPNAVNGIPYERLRSHLKIHVPRLEGGNYSAELRDMVAFCLEEDPRERPTIDNVQRHGYIYNTSSTFPTSNLRSLVGSFRLWESRGGDRKSLFMQHGAQGPSTPAGYDEWTFSTTEVFDKKVLEEFSTQDVLDAYGPSLVNFEEETTRPSQKQPKGSRRRPPPEALARLPAPLEKIFDPNTLSNYEDNSRVHYGRIMPGPTTSDLPLRDDSAQTSIIDTMIDLGGHDSETGLSSFADMDTIKAGRRQEDNDDSYNSTSQDFTRPALSDPADINPNRRTQDWKFPSMAPPASADPELSRFPASYEVMRPSMTPGSSSRPSLVHHPTEPIGAFGGSLLATAQSSMERLSMRESLIDLDMSLPDPIPEYKRPSTANSDVGSTTSEQMFGNPFELERHSLYQPVSNEQGSDPSIYVSEENPATSRIRTGNPHLDLAEMSDFSASDVEGPQGSDQGFRKFPQVDGTDDTDYSSMPPPPIPAQTSSRSSSNEPYTMAHFPDLPAHPSIATLTGTASPREMAMEMNRAISGLNAQLSAFKDVYQTFEVQTRGAGMSREPGGS